MLHSEKHTFINKRDKTNNNISIHEIVDESNGTSCVEETPHHII